MKRLITLCAIVFFIPSVHLLDPEGGEGYNNEPYEQTPEVSANENAGITVRGVLGLHKVKELVVKKNKASSSESSSSSSSESSSKSDKKHKKHEKDKKGKKDIKKFKDTEDMVYRGDINDQMDAEDTVYKEDTKDENYGTDVIKDEEIVTHGNDAKDEEIITHGNDAKDEEIITHVNDAKDEKSKTDDKNGNVDKTKKKRLSMPKINFGHFPCSCSHSVCTCCFGISVQKFKINFKGCVNVTVNTTDLGIHLDVYTGKRVLYHNKVTAVDPPAMCVLLTVVTPVSFCVHLHDIQRYEGNRSVRMCMDFQAKLLTYDVLAVPVACLTGGVNGIHIHHGEKYKA